jgi:hypothetical protein
MSSCKECVHYEVCEPHTEPNEDYAEVGGCPLFKPKSRFVELPCEVGNKVYKIWSVGKHGKSIAEFVVKHIDIDYLPNIEIAFVNEKTKSRNYWFAMKEDIGKTVFLSKEEAEAELRKRGENNA